MIEDYRSRTFRKRTLRERPGRRCGVTTLVADSIESLGDVQVQDITFTTEPTDTEDSVTLTVYYHR